MLSNKSGHLVLLIISILITCPMVSLGQKVADKAAGYIITSGGDTLRGTLTIPRFVTDEGITLYQANQGAGNKYTVKDVRAFGLQDGRRFVKLYIPSSLNPESGRVDSTTVFFQHLIAGKVNFYRYDFNVARHNEGQPHVPSETVQYFISIDNSTPIGVQRRSYQPVLAAIYKDCPAVVRLVPRTTFTERALGNLALHYDTLCQTTTKAYDYRLPEEPNTIRLLVSLRAGLQYSQLTYRSSDYFIGGDATYSTLPAYAVELRLVNKNAWSIIAGVQHSSMRTRVNKYQQAQLGTTNAGQSLVLPASVEIKSWQVPILVRYTLGNHIVQPYLAIGPQFGMFTNNVTTLSYTTLTYVSSSNSYRNDVITATPPTRQEKNPTLSGVVRAGLQLKASKRVSPLLEIQYSKGRNQDNYYGVRRTINGQLELIGPMYYQAFSATAGLEF
jgi:hypothetical protein